MSILKAQIKKLLHHIVDHKDGKITAEISYPDDFKGFEGHFPGKPIVPAVCNVLTVLTLLELSLNQKVYLKSIISSKFKGPVGPKEELVIELRLETQSESWNKVKAFFKSKGNKIVEMLIEVTYE